MIDISKIYTSNNCGDFKITKYTGWNKVHIEFLITGYKVITGSRSVKDGTVRDKLHPSVCGVGFMGAGKYKRNSSKAYYTWKDMLARCYNLKRQKRQPTYIGCLVCEDWHNFQNFAKWFEDNYADGLHMDKDVKQSGLESKIYSPETCVFVSQAENTIEAHARNWSMIDPNGKVHEIYNMSEFCRDKGLNPSDMAKVCRGIGRQSKGWKKA